MVARREPGTARRAGLDGSPYWSRVRSASYEVGKRCVIALMSASVVFAVLKVCATKTASFAPRSSASISVPASAERSWYGTCAIAGFRCPSGVVASTPSSAGARRPRTVRPVRGFVLLFNGRNRPPSSGNRTPRLQRLLKWS